MKTTKNLSDYPDDELKQLQKQTKTIVIVFGCFMLLSSIFLIYSAIKSKNYALIAVACGTSITLTPLIVRLSMINKEVKSRQK